MARQALQVEIAFTATPFADPSTLTWTDVSSSLLIDHGVMVSRGKPNELPQMQAGSVSFVLDNRTGNFDPDYTASAYAPYVVPEVPVRISATFGGTTYRVFYGFIESWVQSWDADGFSLCTVTAVDGLAALLAYMLGIGYTEYLVGEYGGTVGTAFDHYWPFTYAGSASPSQLNFYEGPGGVGAIVSTANDFVFSNGIGLTGLQLQAPGSFYWWQPSNPGSRAYWAGFEGWFRVDSVPAAGAVPACAFFNGNKNGGGPLTPAQGFGIPSTNNDSMSAYVTQNPKNLCAAATADPTSTTSWTGSGAGGTLASVAAATTNALQRIWLDNGATDFYGASAAMRLTTTSSASCDFETPFITGIAAGAYTVQTVITQEQAAAAGSTLQIDWYNGASLLSSSALTSPGTATFGPTLFCRNVTAPATTTQAKIHWVLTTAAGTSHFDMAQIVVGAGSFQSLPWYAGQTTPAQSLLFIVASGAGVAPPGQSNSTTGWPCYASIPFTGSVWTHVAVDYGSDNTAVPYAGTAATRGMPQVWVNGVAARMWTTGDATGTALAGTFLGVCYAGIGASLYGGGTNPTVNVASELYVSFDELYVADANIGAVGRVTAAKALAHYTYGLVRHDFFLQTTGDRVGQILDTLGWPTAQRAIDTGVLFILPQMPDTTGTSLTGLSLIQDATTVEGGLSYVARDGKFTFWDQAHTGAVQQLTAVDQGFETGVGSFTAGNNCTVAQTAAQAHSGTKSLALTSLSTGPMYAISGFYPVAAGQTYTISAWARANTTGRTVDMQVFSCDANQQPAFGTGITSAPTDSNSAWTTMTGSFKIPAGVCYLRVVAGAVTEVVGEVHYFDDFSVVGPPVAALIGDRTDLGELPYQPGPSVSRDKQAIHNTVTLTRNSTDAATPPYISQISDATSVGQYKTQPFAASAPWATNANMDALAASIVADYKTPRSRISAVSVDGVTTEAFASLLARELGDLVVVNIRPRSTVARAISVAAYVQGYTLNITATSWLWTFNLSPTIAGH
jgi:hypothetical protein